MPRPLNSLNATIRVTRRITAPPERVFDAWLDADQARRFLFATPTGRVVRAEVDGRVGGAFRVVDRRGGADADHAGRYVEIDRPRRLVFDFSVDESPETRVAVDVVPREPGSEVTLTTELPPQYADFADRAHAGWASILERLARVVEGEPAA
ncbi:MAG: hypothetical protein JWM27_933 [Gemmatimonadetes bacterium]|nr:hypothetical protein [Gemmatimonadota bacterium]